MSQENVEIVCRAFAAFECDGLAGMLPHFDCEIEWTTTDGHIEPATYRGYEGLLHYLGTMAREFDGIRLDAQELIDAGEQVVVTWRIHGREKLEPRPHRNDAYLRVPAVRRKDRPRSQLLR